MALPLLFEVPLQPAIAIRRKLAEPHHSRFDIITRPQKPTKAKMVFHLLAQMPYVGLAEPPEDTSPPTGQELRAQPGADGRSEFLPGYAVASVGQRRPVRPGQLPAQSGILSYCHRVSQ